MMKVDCYFMRSYFVERFSRTDVFKMNTSVATLCLITLATLSLCDKGVSQYTECQSNAQCGPGKCCAIVKGRFDTTACLPLQQLQENCRPASDSPVSTTLHFPGGVSTKVTAHENICPCETGASCSRKGFCERA